MNIKIIIATHKPYKMPMDNIYLPIHVGAEGRESFGLIGDNTGENISVKNPIYCELTGLYWGWKNVDCDYIGLVHYRRHFSYKKKGNDPFNGILNSSEAEDLLSCYDIIVPKRRNYYIDTLETHFNRVKFSLNSDLPMLKSAIDKISPSYVASFDKCIRRTWGHMFNMYIMKKELSDQYCEWLYSVLEEVEKEIDFSTDIHPARRRIIGYLAEFMLDIWLDRNGYEYKEMNTVFIERQNEYRKVFKFLIRRFRK